MCIFGNMNIQYYLKWCKGASCTKVGCDGIQEAVTRQFLRDAPDIHFSAPLFSIWWQIFLFHPLCLWQKAKNLYQWLAWFWSGLAAVRSHHCAQCTCILHNTFEFCKYLLVLYLVNSINIISLSVVYQFVCLCDCLSVCLPACLSVYLQAFQILKKLRYLRRVRGCDPFTLRFLQYCIVNPATLEDLSMWI